jgi:cation/acetate symporter
MAVGTVATLALIWSSPTIQVDVLGRTDAWFPLKNPAMITIPLSFAVGIVVSLLTADVARGDTAILDRQMLLGRRVAHD